MGVGVDVRAEWPGVVQEIRVKVGDSVSEEDELLSLESMKMITPILAPTAGVVGAVHVAEGDQVAEDDLLLTLE